MFDFLKRNAIFILFPLVIVALVFLAQINFSSGTRIGEWGTRSIVESTLVLLKEKVDRIEESIFITNHTFFQALSPAEILYSCDRWQQAINISTIVKAGAIIDEDGLIVQYYHRDKESNFSKKTYELLRNDIVPLLFQYESLNQHKHLHRLINGKYYLVTSFTQEFEGQYYTACLVYDTDEILETLFGNIIADVGPDKMVNVIDHSDRIIFGGNLASAGDFIVVRRFPSTLYKWRVQLAPKAGAFFTGKARSQIFSQWLLISLAFGVIIFGIVVLYMVMVRERRLNRLKSEFIANASHELKTPLALIRMFSELLTMSHVQNKEKIRQYHEIILRETERLTALVDNVLDFSKIERGKSDYDFRVMDLREVVEPSLAIYRHRISEIDAKLVYKTEEVLPSVKIDKDSITLSLVNLIDNAVKYANGTDVIGVEVYASGKYIHLDVYDHGSGIPLHHQKRIFERFYRYQAENLETQGQRGSGIGLSLVKQIVKAHGGSVSVTSNKETETRFSIKLPQFFSK